MAGLDLSGVAKVLDGWILDEVEITDDSGAADDVLDPATGKLTPPAPRVVYGGRGAILPHDRTPRVPDPGVQVVAQETAGQHRLLLPHNAGAPELRAGMKVRVTVARGTIPDPLLARRRFQVVDLTEVGSFHVGHFTPLKQIGLAPASPPAPPGP